MNMHMHQVSLKGLVACITHLSTGVKLNTQALGKGELRGVFWVWSGWSS